MRDNVEEKVERKHQDIYGDEGCCLYADDKAKCYCVIWVQVTRILILVTFQPSNMGRIMEADDNENNLD